MHRTIRICLLLTVIVFGSYRVNAQASKYQALYIYNFTKYMNFTTDKVTIGVLGNSPVLLELQKRAQTGSNLQIIKLAGDDRVTECNIVFIPEAQERNFSLIQNRVGDAPIVIVSETEAMLAQGAEIAFYYEGSKLKFALNKPAMDASKVKVSNSLLGLAKIVN